MEIKQESCLPHFSSENGRDLYFEDHLIEVKNEAISYNSDYKTDTKTEKEEESYVLGYSQNEAELFTNEIARKLNGEVVSGGNECEIDNNRENKDEGEVSNFCSPNKGEFYPKDAVMKVNDECNKQYEMDSKVEFKAEPWWLESSSRDVPYVFHEIKDEIADNFASTQTPRLHTGESSDMPALNSGEDLGKNVSLNIIKDGTECKSPRKYESQENVCSEQPGNGKMDSTTLCSKQNSVILQENTHKNNSYKKYADSSTMVNDMLISEYKCEQNLTSPSYLKLHKFVHDNKKPHMCKICGRNFTLLSNLKRHKLIHEGIKPRKCDKCGKCFTDSYFKKHKFIHEGKKPHKCEICGKHFTQLTTLKRHILIHASTKPHNCEICGKKFTHLSQLNEHKLIHEGRKPHMCEICGYQFTHVSNLKKHQYNHEGRKPHQCEVCGKNFTRSSHLKAHKLIHEAKKPHKCDNCDKSFTQLSHLKRHKMIHEARKPHKCDICGKRFTQFSNLKRHRSEIHTNV